MRHDIYLEIQHVIRANMLLLSLSVEPWTTKQTSFLRIRCASFISKNIVLKKKDCEMIKNENKVLFSRRTWRDIKNKVNE